jgi:uncharacterized HAD superfamily protein
MKKLLTYQVIAVMVLVSLVACDGNSDKVKELETQVMDVHDEVMPKMDAVASLSRQLTAKIGELDSLQLEGASSNTLAEERMKAIDLKQQLSISDSLMMEWMYNYDADSAKSLRAEKALEYYNSELNRISEVKEKTLKSIKDAELFLKK